MRLQVLPMAVIGFTAALTFIFDFAGLHYITPDHTELNPRFCDGASFQHALMKRLNDPHRLINYPGANVISAIDPMNNENRLQHAIRLQIKKNYRL